MRALAGELRERGPLSRQQLREATRARLWGPGRFRHALRVAMEDGDIRKSGAGHYEAARR